IKICIIILIDYYSQRYIPFILYLLFNYNMIGKCESYGTSNIEVIPAKENGKEKLLCNQCRPADGAYGY
ncbi:MAG TPA: hypothetical protein VIY98_03670, partial [Nitrososphaeraceae archaeon]